MILKECSLSGERESGMWTSCMAEIQFDPESWCDNCRLRHTANAAAAEQREACAKFIEQASAREGRPVHAERCRAAPLVVQ